MAKFNKGDKVVRCVSRQCDNGWLAVVDPAGPKAVKYCDSTFIELEGCRDTWDPKFFELNIEPQPEPVTVTEPPVQQIPGVPDGYRLVRIGAPKKGEQFIIEYGVVSGVADSNMYDYTWAIVEPIAPPAPPTPISSTVTVQLNRYLVGDLKNGKVCVCTCTAEYAEFNLSSYRLLGPSETLELEVEV